MWAEMSELLANLEDMSDEKLEIIIDTFPDLSILAQLILEERQRREVDDEQGVLFTDC